MLSLMIDTYFSDIDTACSHAKLHATPHPPFLVQFGDTDVRHNVMPGRPVFSKASRPCFLLFPPRLSLALSSRLSAHLIFPSPLSLLRQGPPHRLTLRLATTNQHSSPLALGP